MATTKSRIKNRITTPSTGNGSSEPKPTGGKVAVVIHPPKLGRLQFRLVGSSPLVVHNFDAKSRQEMLEKQMRAQTKTKRAPRSPQEEFLGSFYWVDCAPPPCDWEDDDGPHWKPETIAKALKNATFGIPVTGFKNAMISAGRNTDLPMTIIRQTIFVSGAKHKDWAIIDGAATLDARICRLQKKTPIERFRGMFAEWSTDINIEFDANMLNASQVANLLAVAGYYVGVFEGRPERSSLGWGRWTVETV